VKAGALKVGDQISTVASLSELRSSAPLARSGVNKISGDQAVTIKSITTDNTPHRVYNLEIESRDGEITHNYFVGEDEVWVHNAGHRKKRPSTKGKHEKGDARCKRDQCGITRKRPKGHKGPWPPRTTPSK